MNLTICSSLIEGVTNCISLFPQVIKHSFRWWTLCPKLFQNWSWKCNDSFDEYVTIFMRKYLWRSSEFRFWSTPIWKSYYCLTFELNFGYGTDSRCLYNRLMINMMILTRYIMLSFFLLSTSFDIWPSKSWNYTQFYSLSTNPN